MPASFLKILSTAFLLAVSIFLAVKYGSGDLRDIVQEAGVYAPAIFIAVCFLKPVLIFLPSLGLTVIAGVLFGPVYGTIYVAVGGAGSTIVGFYFAKWLGRDIVERLAKNRKIFFAVEEWMNAEGKKTVLAMRLFNLPWDIVSYWAGITGVPFRDFYIASLLPLVPMSFIYVYFGSSIFSPSSPGFIISLSIILSLGAIPYVIKRRRGRK